MALPRVFVSFDLDHDNDCKQRFIDQVGEAADGEQAADGGSQYLIRDWSIREVAKDWEDKARKRLANVDLLVVICGEYTDTAPGVNTEITLAREIGMPAATLFGCLRRGWIGGRQDTRPPCRWIITADHAEVERLRALHQLPAGYHNRRRWTGDGTPIDDTSKDKEPGNHGREDLRSSY